mgnify:FL=1
MFVNDECYTVFEFLPESYKTSDTRYDTFCPASYNSTWLTTKQGLDVKGLFCSTWNLSLSPLETLTISNQLCESNIKGIET